MQITVWALVCLILSSTFASGDCVVQPQEDELVPQQFNFSAFRWDGNNTTSPQKVTDEESKAILESLLDSSWVGNNTTYLQRIPEENTEAILGNLKPSIQKDYAMYVFFLAPWDPIVIVVDYVLHKWLAKKAKARMGVGSSGFTCQCGVDNINFMRAKNCCSDVKTRQNGKVSVQYFGNCEVGCNEICYSKWDFDAPRPCWKHNICSKHAL
jgi:hypothetical protein